MSMRVLDEITNVPRGFLESVESNQSERLERVVDDGMAKRALVRESSEPMTPDISIERSYTGSARSEEKAFLCEMVTRRMLGAEQRLRHLLESEGWTPSPRRNRSPQEHLQSGAWSSPMSYEQKAHLVADLPTFLEPKTDELEIKDFDRNRGLFQAENLHAATTQDNGQQKISDENIPVYQELYQSSGPPRPQISGRKNFMAEGNENLTFHCGSKSGFEDQLAAVPDNLKQDQSKDGLNRLHSASSSNAHSSGLESTSLTTKCPDGHRLSASDSSKQQHAKGLENTVVSIDDTPYVIEDSAKSQSKPNRTQVEHQAQNVYSEENGETSLQLVVYHPSPEVANEGGLFKILASSQFISHQLDQASQRLRKCSENAPLVLSAFIKYLRSILASAHSRNTLDLINHFREYTHSMARLLVAKLCLRKFTKTQLVIALYVTIVHIILCYYFLQYVEHSPGGGN